MTITTKSRTISRKKLQDLTGDHETTVYLESLQGDISGPLTSGVNNAQTSAGQAQTDASVAKTTADNAQTTASQAIGAAASAQTTATTAQNSADTAQSTASGAQSDATYARNLADTINANYVSKTVVAAQSVAGTLQATSFFVAGTKVVGPRDTGWTAAVGTANKGAFSPASTYTVSATYTQSEVVAIGNALSQANQRIIALESAMRAHGLIN